MSHSNLDAEGIVKYYEERNKKPYVEPTPENATEDDEDDSQTGLCHGCRDHSTPVYRRYIISGERTDDEPVSDCCGDTIELN